MNVEMFTPGRTDNYKRTVAHEVGHRLPLSTRNLGQGEEHDLPPYPELSKGAALVYRTFGLLFDYSKQHDKTDLGKWLRQEDWNAANERAVALKGGRSMRTLCAQLGVIIFALCSVAGLAQDPLESFDMKVKRLFDNPVGIKIDQLAGAAPALTLQEASELAGQDRNQIIAVLHEVLRDPDLRGESGYGYSKLFQVLLQLGDERGMQLAAETLRTEPELRESNSRSWWFAEDIARAAQPAVLPYIAPLLFLNETPESDVTVSGDIPTGDKISFQAGDIVHRVIEAAEAIPWEVKEWSRQLGRSRSRREEYREILREWWKANEETFRRKDYAAVRPGRELPKTETAAAEPAPPVLPEPTWEPPPIAPASTPAPSKEEASPIATTPSDQQSWWGFVAAAIFALALAGLLFFGSKRA